MKNLILFTVTILALCTISCHSEGEVQHVNSQQNLTKNSALTFLISRVCQNPTFRDNCIDGTSCFSVVLPTTVTINGQVINITSDADYDIVKSIKNQSTTDDDIVHYTFPVTIEYANFQQVTLNNQDEFDTVITSCDSDGSFHEIGCIDFNYPFVINYYNKTNQTPGNITVDTNMELYNFIAGLNSDDIYTIVYPLSMTHANGSTVVYNNNTQLQSAIENVIHDCDEPNTTDPELSEILVDGSWYVSSFIDRDDDETYEFNGYTFIFNSDGTAVANKNTIPPTYGNWNIFQDGGFTKFDISLDGSVLDEIEKDWLVIEYTPILIKLRHQSGGGGENHYLTLTKI